MRLNPRMALLPSAGITDKQSVGTQIFIMYHDYYPYCVCHFLAFNMSGKLSLRNLYTLNKYVRHILPTMERNSEDV